MYINNKIHKFAPKVFKDWVVLGQEKTVDLIDNDPAMKGRRWTIDISFNSGKSFEKFQKGLKK